MEQVLPKGFIPVMLTPFQDNGEIDFDALARLTQLYLDAGAAGLFANCLSSEMYELSMNERLQIIEHIVHKVNGKVPVVATGSFGNTLAEQANFIKCVYEKGVHAVILITSLIANAEEPDPVFDDRVFKLLDLTDEIPLGFYECPVPYKRVLKSEQLGRFVQTGRVIYHKDTCLDINCIREKLKVTHGNGSFGLYDAYMGHAVRSLKAGASGLSCIQGNFFQELVVWLCENYQDPGKVKEVKSVEQFFIDHMHVMHHVYPFVAKYFLRQRGFPINTFTRQQVGMFTHQVSIELDQLYSDYENLLHNVEIEMVN